MDDEYREPFDIRQITAQMREAWECMPDASLGEFLDEAFGGVSVHDLDGNEAREILNDFILQNR